MPRLHWADFMPSSMSYEDKLIEPVEPLSTASRSALLTRKIPLVLLIQRLSAPSSRISQIVSAGQSIASGVSRESARRRRLRPPPTCQSRVTFPVGTEREDRVFGKAVARCVGLPLSVAKLIKPGMSGDPQGPRAILFDDAHPVIDQSIVCCICGQAFSMKPQEALAPCAHPDVSGPILVDRTDGAAIQTLRRQAPA